MYAIAYTHIYEHICVCLHIYLSKAKMKKMIIAVDDNDAALLYSDDDNVSKKIKRLC